MMKKTLAVFGAAILAAMALSACNAEDGKINDYKSRGVVPSEDTYSSRRFTSETSSSRRYDNTDSHDGIIHDVGSMTENVVEDVAEGMDNVGSTIESNVEDFFNGDSNTAN